MEKKISVEDRERIENRLREMQVQKNLKEMHKHREDDKWDITHMSEFDFARCDYSRW